MTLTYQVVARSNYKKSGRCTYVLYKNDSFQSYNVAIEEFNKQCHNDAIMMQRTKGSRIIDIVVYFGYSFSYKAFFNDTSPHSVNTLTRIWVKLLCGVLWDI